MEATSSAADLVNPRLTWDTCKSATRPDVFTVDVFELVALRWLSGEEVPKEYQTPIFHDTVELAQPYLPNLTLCSGCRPKAVSAFVMECKKTYYSQHIRRGWGDTML